MTSTTPHARWIATDELPISEYTEDYPTEKKSICWDDILNDKVK